MVVYWLTWLREKRGNKFLASSLYNTALFESRNVWSYLQLMQTSTDLQMRTGIQITGNTDINLYTSHCCLELSFIVFSHCFCVCFSLKCLFPVLLSH